MNGFLFVLALLSWQFDVQPKPIPVVRSESEDMRFAAAEAGSEYWQWIRETQASQDLYAVKIDAGADAELLWLGGRYLVLESEYGEEYLVGRSDVVLASRCNGYEDRSLVPFSRCRLIQFRPNTQIPLEMVQTRSMKDQILGHLAAPKGFGTIVGLHWRTTDETMDP